MSYNKSTAVHPVLANWWWNFMPIWYRYSQGLTEFDTQSTQCLIRFISFILVVVSDTLWLMLTYIAGKSAENLPRNPQKPFISIEKPLDPRKLIEKPNRKASVSIDWPGHSRCGCWWAAGHCCYRGGCCVLYSWWFHLSLKTVGWSRLDWNIFRSYCTYPLLLAETWMKSGTMSFH